MKSLILPSIVLFLASCTTPRALERKTSDNNTDYKVDYLFEHDGCKVYRFYDRGNYVYFTNCKGEAITATDSSQVTNTIRIKP